MEQPIIVRYRWSADDLLQARRYHLRQSWRRVFLTLFSVAIYALAILLCLGAISAYRAGHEWISPLVIPLLAVCWLFRPFWHRRMVLWQFARRPDKDSEVEWQITPYGISARTPLAHSEIRWESIVKMVRTPCGLMLHTLPNLFHYLPRRGFASGAEFERAIELAKSKVPKFLYVT